MEVILLNADLE